ncbi:MAG: hypothetical protein MK171_01315 [Pirellulales bacterium]|nr:hypothetical protein [Pirellulales bacterium]
MLQIIEHHGGLVPVDVDPSTLELPLAKVDALLTERSRLVLVAHLFWQPHPDKTPHQSGQAARIVRRERLRAGLRRSRVFRTPKV